MTGEAIPCIGWVQLNFQLSEGQPLLQIPFPVTEKHLNLPLIGYNVIEHYVKSNNLSSHIMNSVSNDVPVKSVEALVEFIQAAAREQLGDAKSSKKDYTWFQKGRQWTYHVGSIMVLLQVVHLLYSSQMSFVHGQLDWWFQKSFLLWNRVNQVKLKSKSQTLQNMTCSCQTG